MTSACARGDAHVDLGHEVDAAHFFARVHAHGYMALSANSAESMDVRRFRNDRVGEATWFEFEAKKTETFETPHFRAVSTATCIQVWFRDVSLGPCNVKVVVKVNPGRASKPRDVYICCRLGHMGHRKSGYLCR
jgi:hypothetical protein